jgi:ribosome-associated protein
MNINDTVSIPDDELRFTFARASGPGGQNVNKVSSKAVLRWDLAANTSVPAEVKDRLRALQRRRVTNEGELVIQGQRFRDQGRNVLDCLARLREIVLEALAVPKPRKATRPSRAAKRRRLEAKRRQSRRKAGRREPGTEDL